MRFENDHRSAATYAANGNTQGSKAMNAIRPRLTTNQQCAMPRLFTDRYSTRTDQEAIPMTGSARISAISYGEGAGRRKTRSRRALRRNVCGYPNSRYASRVISRRAADGTKSRGPAAARPRTNAGRCGGSWRGVRAVVADAQTGGRPTDARRTVVRRRDRCARANLARRTASPMQCRRAPSTIDDQSGRAAAACRAGRYPVTFDYRG